MVNTVRIGRRGFWDGLGRAHWNAVAVYIHQQKTWVPVHGWWGRKHGAAISKRKTSVYLFSLGWFLNPQTKIYP